MDNDGTHKHANVKAWLKRHPRFVSHFGNMKITLQSRTRSQNTTLVPCLLTNSPTAESPSPASYSQ
jgi:hypothetical protein